MALVENGDVCVNGTSSNGLDHGADDEEAKQLDKQASSQHKWVISRRRHSSLGPRPVTRFGPKAQLIDDHSVRNDMSAMCDPSSMVLGWKQPPQNVLVIGKQGDGEVNRCFKELVTWLVTEMKLVIYAEPSLLQDSGMAQVKHDMKNINNWVQGETAEDKIDFIISLGGDGTLLYAASLFQANCPPIVSFHMGSLGFLTSFQFLNYKQDLAAVMKGNGKLILRNRLDCRFMPSRSNMDHNDNFESKDKCFRVLNELVIDRGNATYLSNLDVYCNDRLITSVQGDGLIVSTPTGSTAYAAAAGGSMVHPSVPGILITPVCAHVLSSRPVIVPAGVVLKIILSDDSRSGAFASFDGKNRQELRSGEGICVTTSIYPVPCLTKEDQINDWFKSLGECFQWNIRKRQKML